MPLWSWSLLLLWGTLLFGGFIVGRPVPGHTHRTPTAARMLSSFTLVVAAVGWAWVVQRQGSPLATTMALVAAGMACGWLGDLALANIASLPEPTLIGMALFGFGHLSYIAGLLIAGARLGLGEPTAWVSALAVWGLVAIIGWYLVVWRGNHPMVLHAAALPYALLLATTAAVGTALALQSTTFVAVAVGAGLFLLSDLLLAGELFGGLSFPSIGDVVWMMYGPGQALIVFGTEIAMYQSI